MVSGNLMERCLIIRSGQIVEFFRAASVGSIKTEASLILSSLPTT